MIQKWSRYRILEQFFDRPRRQFLVRELSRTTGLATTAVDLHLKALAAEKLIVKNKGGLYRSFSAAAGSPLFCLLKTQNLIFRLHKTGLLDYLEKRIHPTCVVLFGSASRGEDTEESDIDIFIQAKRSDIDVGKYEKALRRKIQLLFEPNMKMISPELLNNLANGTVLSGYLKVA